MDNPFGAAGTAEFVLLTTYKKDGTGVGTPLWAVLDGGKLYAWTPTDSWKVKRLRRNPAVTVQPCDRSGKPLAGDVVSGTAQVMDGPGTERVRGLIRRKYPILGTLIVLGSKIRRGSSGTVGIEITA
ncbi:PPOX class F420-dependent oxidoreductase [Nocardia stercoris]|uniref:PPOX class F420-dependent oxidoreductase n=1 Tax=Nocardia stercoris TaxID=2483361 RepID=A0A3M2LA26_9NOCA|nr:PPOX class F420-dependent oxidoreductase [Nocardia stercoris]RMI31428.1 PPOX class F420-dependent oxidoreductase [Nocardia stercoris]